MLPLFNLKAFKIGPIGQIRPIFLAAPRPGLTDSAPLRLLSPASACFIPALNLPYPASF